MGTLPRHYLGMAMLREVGYVFWYLSSSFYFANLKDRKPQMGINDRIYNALILASFEGKHFHSSLNLAPEAIVARGSGVCWDAIYWEVSIWPPGA